LVEALAIFPTAAWIPAFAGTSGGEKTQPFFFATEHAQPSPDFRATPG
jgi:hypothetical protein